MVFACNNGYLLYGYTNQLTSIPTGTIENLNDVMIYYDYRIFSCGDNGTILITSLTNQGWITDIIDVSGLFPSGKSPKLNAIAAAPLSRGGGIYIEGNGGILIKSDDGGISWSSISTGSNHSLNDIDINDQAIYIVGDNCTILKKSW